MSPVSSKYEGRALLDIASFAKRGPAQRLRLTDEEFAIIDRTARRTPEVMVKVSGGGSSVNGVAAHFKYIDRKGDLDIETDDGQQLKGKGVEDDLMTDWSLAEELAESAMGYSGKPGRKPRKLVHNIILSMPAGTSPEKLLAASKEFAREQFATKNRYAMVLHTDQQHPHVHLVVKAQGEDGQRLNIRKATLREWRSEFARHLREQGVAANATERAVRDQLHVSKPDGVYRAEQRGDTLRQPVQSGAANDVEVLSITAQTRQAVRAGWQVVFRVLAEMQREQDVEHNRSGQPSAPLWPERPSRWHEVERDGFTR